MWTLVSYKLVARPVSRMSCLAVALEPWRKGRAVSRAMSLRQTESIATVETTYLCTSTRHTQDEWCWAIWPWVKAFDSVIPLSRSLGSVLVESWGQGGMIKVTHIWMYECIHVYVRLYIYFHARNVTQRKINCTCRPTFVLYINLCTVNVWILFALETVCITVQRFQYLHRA